MRRVYFIKPVGMDGPIKVGCSLSPDMRRKTLETWSPFALEVVAEIEGDFDLEARFHALFQETHQRREWFGWSKRIAAVLAAINDGTFAVETLPSPLLRISSTKGKGSRPRKPCPYKAFSIAYFARLRAIEARGLSRKRRLQEAPSFNYFALIDAPYSRFHPKPADAAAMIRACEAYAANITAEYGHSRMKPVLWKGPYPSANGALEAAA